MKRSLGSDDDDKRFGVGRKMLVTVNKGKIIELFNSITSCSLTLDKLREYLKEGLPVDCVGEVNVVVIFSFFLLFFSLPCRIIGLLFILQHLLDPLTSYPGFWLKEQIVRP